MHNPLNYICYQITLEKARFLSGFWQEQRRFSDKTGFAVAKKRRACR